MKKIISSLSIICLMLATSVLTIGCSNKENEHPSQYVGKYFFDIVSIKRSGVSADVDMEGAVYDAFTNEGYILLNKDGSVETNLYQKSAEYFSNELGYVPTYYYEYQWHVNYDNIYFTGFGEFYDQVGKVLNEFFNYVLLASTVQFYSLSGSTLTGNGSSGFGSGAYTYTITFKKAN